MIGPTVPEVASAIPKLTADEVFRLSDAVMMTAPDKGAVSAPVHTVPELTAEYAADVVV